jgi:hypothetical protein
MRRISITCLTLIAAALLVLPAAASAQKSKAKTPQITRVQPMRVTVGGTLTITGRNFKAQRRKNTVIFRANNGRTAFAKPRRATRKKLVVRVPASVARLLTVANSRQKPTRLKLRVLAGKFSKFTPRRLSPVVTGIGDGNGGPGSGGAAAVCNNDSDHDNDLLPNDVELSIGTDPCLEDTDKDQMSDGWEHWSAKDLNVKAVPYPGKKPFPNALDPTDGGPAGATFSSVDFDGDGLTTLEEYRTWRISGSSFDETKAGGLDLESPLGYSDGTKFSRAGVAGTPSVPLWRGPAYGLAPPDYLWPDTYDLHSDGAWRDDERDADADGLANFLESARGPGKPSWWAGFYGQETMKAEPWGAKPATSCGQEFGSFDRRPFAELDIADPDVDGDRLLDGEDDQDNDDVSNIAEMYEPFKDLDGDGGFLCGAITYPSYDLDPGPGVDPRGVNAFNPCAPNPNSRTCQDWKPFS